MDKFWRSTAENVRFFNEVPPAEVSAQGIRDLLGSSDDFITAPFCFGKVQVNLFCIDGLVKDTLVDENILSAFHEMEQFRHCSSQKKAVTLLEQGYLQHASVKKVDTLRQAVEAILSANFVMVFDACRCAFVFDVKGFEKRSIEEPENESVIGGSKDGFSEPLRVNTAIVRRHLRSHYLAVEQFEVGRVSKTTLALVYMKNIASPGEVEALKKQIEQLDMACLLSLGQLEQALGLQSGGVIPSAMPTERADKLCANLLGGRIGILTDGYPVAYIVPANLAMFMQAPEDYNTVPVYASFVRLIRYVCLGVNLLLPALYIAVANFSCEILPAKLAQAIMQAKFGMPFSTLTEVILMLIAFEILIEAGLRLPNGVGQAVSIVSGLIVGDAAVNAKLASPAVVMLTAIAGIASFVLPYQSLANSLRVIRFALVLAAAAGGLFSLALMLTIILFYFNSVEHLQLPFLTPFSTGGLKDWLRDTVVRRSAVES